MEVIDLVRGHYSGDDLEGTILGALSEAGVDVDHLTVADLAAVDQLHAGASPATAYLLEQLDLSQDSRLLDVGCGIGGPARLAADRYACSVTGVDLSPAFVRLGRALTARVGLPDRVTHHLGTGEVMNFGDGSFDRAMMVHVGMNIPDKAAVFAEVRRVVAPGGVFGLYEQMRIGDEAPTYPLPWAEDERSSFVESPETYRELLARAGFEVERTEDRTAAVARPPGGEQRLSQAAVFGPRFAERIANNVAAMRARILAPVVILARAP